MILKKLALPGEDKEDTLTSSDIPAAWLGGENLTVIFFPFEELDFLGINQFEHGIAQFKLWDTDLIQGRSARHMSQGSWQCQGLEATHSVGSWEATPHFGGSTRSKEAQIAGQAVPTLGMLQQQQPQSHLLLWNLWVPVGHLSQTFEQVLEEGWVALWAVIVFTALLAEALIHMEGRSLLRKKKKKKIFNKYLAPSLPKGRIGPILLLKYPWCTDAP